MRRTPSWIVISKIQHTQLEIADSYIWREGEGVLVSSTGNLRVRIAKSTSRHHARIEDRHTVDDRGIDSRICVYTFQDMDSRAFRLNVEPLMNSSQPFDRSLLREQREIR